MLGDPPVQAFQYIAATGVCRIAAPKMQMPYYIIYETASDRCHCAAVASLTGVVKTQRHAYGRCGPYSSNCRSVRVSRVQEACALVRGPQGAPYVCSRGKYACMHAIHQKHFGQRGVHGWEEHMGQTVLFLERLHRPDAVSSNARNSPQLWQVWSQQALR